MSVPDPKNKAAVSFRLKKKIKDDLNTLSEATGRSQTFLVEEALEGYLDLQLWQVKAIKEGIASADRGEFYTTEEILEHLESKRNEYM